MLQPSKAFLDPPLTEIPPGASLEAQQHTSNDLTQASRTTHESEARFHEMLDALPAAIYTTDAEGRLTYFNPAAVEFSGRIPQLGTDQWCVSWKLYHADGRPMPHHECPMAIALKEGRVMRDVEAMAERPDGTRIWFTPYPSPLRDGTGKIIGGINMLVNITRRKKADEELRESQAQLAAELADTKLLQQTSAAIISEENVDALYHCIMDVAVAIMHSDFASMQMLYPDRGKTGELRLLAFRGFTPEAAKSWEWVNADSACTCGIALRTRKRTIVTDMGSSDPIIAAEGRATYLQTGIQAVQSTPLVSRSGKLVGMISTHWRKPYEPSERDLRVLDILARQAADLIERRMAEETVRESEERYRSLASVITDIPWTTNADGRFITTQQIWEKYTGQKWEDYRDFGWLNALHPDDRERLVQVWNEACQKSSLYECRGRLWHSGNQRYRHFVSRAVPLFDADGKVREWVGACTDIDDQIRTEAALRQSVEEARAASQAKDDFLAALSHELRTPLTPVLMIAAASETDPAMPPDAREQFSVIRRNVELEVRLIDDLLDITRISHGKLQIKMSVADLHEVLKHTAEIVRSEALSKNISLRSVLNAPRHHVMGDSARLHQVFWNLIRNALKFTSVGGEVTVTTSNDSAGRTVVSVTDTGIGISAHVLPRIFDAFEQGEATGQRRFGGLGLGLAISKAIVEMHGGTIQATSAGAGLGATFTVALATVEVPAPGSSVVSTAPGVHRSLRLLMVEDHEPTRSVLARLLTSHGHSVVGVSTARDALEAVDSHGFDAVISDLGLPDRSGLDLMRDIRRKQDCFGIALSGYGTEEDVRRTQEAGFFMHLVKPVNFDELCQVLALLPSRPESLSNRTK